MAIWWYLDVTETFIPEPEFREAAEVDVIKYLLASVDITDYGQINLTAWGSTTLGSASLENVTLDAENNSRAKRAFLTDADVADDIPTEQTATSGGLTTVTKTGAGWTVNALTGKVIVFTDGTNGNADMSVRGSVVSNTADTITFTFDPLPDFAAACDNTTKFIVKTDIYEKFREGCMIEAMAQLEKAGSLTQ